MSTAMRRQDPDVPRPDKLMRLKKKKLPKKLTPLNKQNQQQTPPDVSSSVQNQEVSKSEKNILRLEKVERMFAVVRNDFKGYAKQYSEAQKDIEQRISELDELDLKYEQTIREFIKEQQGKNSDVQQKTELLLLAYKDS